MSVKRRIKMLFRYTLILCLIFQLQETIRKIENNTFALEYSRAFLGTALGVCISLCSLILFYIIHI